MVDYLRYTTVEVPDAVKDRFPNSRFKLGIVYHKKGELERENRWETRPPVFEGHISLFTVPEKGGPYDLVATSTSIQSDDNGTFAIAAKSLASDEEAVINLLSGHI